MEPELICERRFFLQFGVGYKILLLLLKQTQLGFKRMTAFFI